MKIAIINYNMGNLASPKAVENFDFDVEIISSQSNSIILINYIPGVGALMKQ